VDPLDGTKEFIQGLPEYAVSVAPVEGGGAALAVVHNPATGELWRTMRGDGAFRERKPLVAEQAEEPAGRPALLASRTELAADEFLPFEAEWSPVPRGSIAYKLALVAEGRGVATLSRGPKWEWDVCAGALLVEEAGGIATDIFGDPLVFNQPLPRVRGIVAGAPPAHRRLLEQLRTLPVLARMREAEG
jgi:myo-inositol-1(or 4)-monophosphatase